MKRADIHLTNKAMNKKKYTLLLLLAALLLLPVAANAQKDLKIQEVFQRYGKNRNVTMVELSNEMLETYGMTNYKRGCRGTPVCEALPGFRSGRSAQDKGGDRWGRGYFGLLPDAVERGGHQSVYSFQSEQERRYNVGLHRRRSG